MSINSFFKSLANRKLINSNEAKVSYTQIFGLILIVFGVVTITISGLFNLCSSIIAISFFITMLGVAFAYPSLLEGNDGLSTMRIVVFMMVSVISLLLIKIGWNKDSLKNIELDKYWTGVIAFVFGAKAVQSYFESTIAKEEAKTKKVGAAALNFSNADIAKLAVEQNQQYLRVKFPNIVSISDAVNDLNQPESHVIAIYLKDSDTKGIPDRLIVKMQDGTVKNISAEIIKGLGVGKIHFSQQNSEVSNINSPDYLGCICCAIKSTSDPNFLGIVTAAHIMTSGKFDDNSNGILNPLQQSEFILNGSNSGIWFYKLLTSNQDLAVLKFNAGIPLSNDCKSFNNKFYEVTDVDIKSTNPNITIISKNNNVRDAYILDYGIGLDLNYTNGPFYKKDIILIGSSIDRNNSRSVSEPGDSGSCVFKKDSNQLIGILLGGDDKFSYVLPIANALMSNNFLTI